MEIQADQLHVEVLDGADRGASLWFPAPGAVVLGRAGTPDLHLSRLTDSSLLDCRLQVTTTRAGEIRIAALGPEGTVRIAGRPVREALVSSGGLVQVGEVTLRLSLARGDTVVGAVPPARLSQFHIVEEIGKGAFSRVYEALDRTTGRSVALKRLRIEGAEVQDTLVSAFLREIQTAASLDHPGIARVLGAGRRGDDLFLVLEYIDGPDLDACVRIQGPLDETLVTRIGLGMLDGLAHAHRRGVIHRDVKPSNVMLTGDGTHPGVVLVDFGLAVEPACQAAWGLTETGDFRGTPDYTAPECLLDARNHSVASDLFGVGATLYFALTAGPCRPPSGTPGAPVAALARADVVPLSTLRRGVSAGLATVVDRALALDPAGRWTSAKAMLEALARLVQDPLG